MKTRHGQVLKDMAEEAVLTLSLSAHHLIGGSIMFYGQVTNNPTYWVRGLCIEIGFEIVDIISLILNAWPYQIVQDKLRLVTIFHHIPGMLCAPSLILVGYHQNKDLQQIGWSLLLAGGVSLLCDGFKQTKDLETELGQWLILHIINLTGIIIARFIVFPIASYGLLTTVWESATSSKDLIAIAATVGVFSMSIFNVIVIVIMTEKLVKNGLVFLKNKSKSTMIKVE